jgi:hypothetical protein
MGPQQIKIKDYKVKNKIIQPFMNESYTTPSFNEFLNESRKAATSISRAKEIYKETDRILKGDIFLKTNFSNKVFIKAGKKRPTAIKTGAPSTMLIDNKYPHWIIPRMFDVEIEGSTVRFDYDYQQYTVDKKYTVESDAKAWLLWKTEMLISRMMNNMSNDTSSRWEAQAAGVGSSKTEIDPRVDAAFIVEFAKKYKVDLKKALAPFSIANEDFFNFAEKYPLKQTLKEL